MGCKSNQTLYIGEGIGTCTRLFIVIGFALFGPFFLQFFRFSLLPFFEEGAFFEKGTIR